jgi:hypothetical protein
MGALCLQISFACGQSDEKAHPGGRLSGLGISPVRIIRLRSLVDFGSAIGTAESKAFV